MKRKEEVGIHKCSPVSGEVWLHKAVYLVLRTMTQECQLQSTKIKNKKKENITQWKKKQEEKIGKIPKVLSNKTCNSMTSMG